MLVDLSQAAGSYLHDVFVTQMDWWVILGFVAQAMFTARFVIQWIASERAGREQRFALEPQPLHDARAYLDQVSRHWDDALARLKAMVEGT